MLNKKMLVQACGGSQKRPLSLENYLADKVSMMKMSKSVCTVYIIFLSRFHIIVKYVCMTHANKELDYERHKLIIT